MMTVRVLKEVLDVRRGKPQRLQIGPSDQVLRVGCQVDPGLVMVWFIGQRDEQMMPPVGQQGRWFVVVPTGAAVPAPATYVGTALAAGGQLVWHVFEVPEAMSEGPPPAGWAQPEPAAVGASRSDEIAAVVGFVVERQQRDGTWTPVAGYNLRATAESYIAVMSLRGGTYRIVPESA